MSDFFESDLPYNVVCKFKNTATKGLNSSADFSVMKSTVSRRKGENDKIYVDFVVFRVENKKQDMRNVNVVAFAIVVYRNMVTTKK